MSVRLSLLALALLAALGCKGKGHAKVEGVLIPQADGVIEAAEGATLAIPAGSDPAQAELPEGKTVRLAIHRDIPWSGVKQLIGRVEAAGKKPVLLVGRRSHVRAFELEDELEEGERIEVVTYASGKVCVSPPDVPEARCAEGKGHISRAYTRQFVREMVERSGTHNVVVHVPPALSWADMIRALDGARTCCGEDVTMHVALAK